jgi:transposase
MTTPQLLSPDDVAEILDVSTSTLAKWRQTGNPHLPFLRINGRIRYRETDIEQFLEDAESEDDTDDEMDDEEDEEDQEDDEDSE